MIAFEKSALTTRVVNPFLNFLEIQSSRKAWPLVVLGVSLVIAFCCSIPYYPAVNEFIQSPYGQAKTWWLEHPLQSVPVEQFFPLNERHIGYNEGIASHLDKMTFRVFLPLLNQVFPFGIWTLVAACHICGVLIFCLTYSVVKQATGDGVCGGLASWALAATYAGQWGFHDYYFGDAVPVALLMCAMATRVPVLAFVFVIAAGLSDERAVFAGPLVGLFWGLRNIEQDGKSQGNWVEFFFKFLRGAWSVWLALAAYAGFRVFCRLFTQISSGTSMLGLLDIIRGRIYSDYPVLFFKVFEFLWFLPLYIFIEKVLKNDKWAIAAGFLILFAAVPSFLVWDLDRSLFYLLPGIWIFLFLWPFTLKSLRILLFGLLSGNLLWFFASSSVLRKIDHFFSGFLGEY